MKDNEDCRIAAIVLTAGSSSRMRGIKKEYHKLANGITILESSVKSFFRAPSIKRIVIAVTAGEENIAREAIAGGLLTSAENSNDNAREPEIIFVNGGNERRASVFNALSVLLPYNPRYVLIHDGARPYISVSLIENIISAVKKRGAVIPLLALTDTPKETGIWNSQSDEQKEVFIKRHLKRANVGTAQTPQAFKFPEIYYAHKKAAAVNEEFTDDAEIWGRFRGKVAAIEGDPANKKITFAEDLDL
ncbi:MAG: 2-C-methyl-D-erythritol 4-phosphate cytidylyltransferase [Treponema sp.]|nr:2-C-methyl-D-erythritol 4-phosphate cytidylyltransferase [Treponema sp.]